MERRRHRAFVPAYGPVESALGYAVFYVFVDVASRRVAAVVPGEVDLVGTGAAALLWLVLVASVAGQAGRQWRNFRRFDTASAMFDFLDRRRPGGEWFVRYAVMAAVAGGVAALAWPGVPDVVASLVLWTVALWATLAPDTASLTVGDVGRLVTFAVAFGLATRGVDRVAVGLARRLTVALYHRYAASD